MFLANNDIPSLKQLLMVAFRNGAGASAIISQLVQCLDGKYSPRGNIPERELAIAFLIKVMGGSQLSFVLAKASGFASVSTVARSYKIPKLIPSISAPSRDEIWANITAFCGTTGKAAPALVPGSIPRAGNILMIDGVAINEVCRYAADRNKILGLCREHSHLVNTQANSFESIQAVEKAIDDGTCHYGKDATVIVIGPYARAVYYTPVPIGVTPSCKQETADQLAKTIKLVLDIWRAHLDGAEKHGPIWTVGSDGESSFRRMRMVLCMSETVPPMSDLEEILGKLCGLNQQTGYGGTTGTCDPKHVIKRECSKLNILLHYTDGGS